MQIVDAWPFQARNQFRCFDSFRDRATDQCGVDRVWWNKTFYEEFKGWKKLEM